MSSDSDILLSNLKLLNALLSAALTNHGFGVRQEKLG